MIRMLSINPAKKLIITEKNKIKLINNKKIKASVHCFFCGKAEVTKIKCGYT